MSFEAYKREAAALERQLEDKVSRYQQVCSASKKCFLFCSTELSPWSFSRTEM
jgi:hypothetical protein